MRSSRHLISTVVLAMVALCGAQTAAAQVTSLGTTTSGPATDLMNGPTTIARASHSAVAYDDKHDVFLHTWENQGTIVGRFINFDGTPAGAAFTIAPAVAVEPVVVYSRGAGDDLFCVLVSQRQPDGSGPTSAIASFVRFTGTGATGGAPVGAPVTLSTGDGTQPAEAVFNPITRRFLLAWAVPAGVAVQQFNGSGSATDSFVIIAAEASTTGPFLGVSGLRLAHDWQQRKYMLTTDERRHALLSYSNVVRVLDDSTLSQAGPSVALMSTHVSLFTTDLADLPEAGGFLASFISPFYEPATGRFVPTADPAGAGASYTLMTGAFNSSAVMEYDALSRRVLVVAASADPRHPAKDLAAALLDGSGQPVGGSTSLRSNTTGFGAPGLRATTGGQFVVSYLNGGSAVLERLSVPLASPAGPRFSNVSGHIDGPVNGATVGSSFLFGGWALDFGASAGTGVDAVHAWAFPTNGSPAIFLGADQIFHARGDLASLYGPHFTGSGFDISVNGLGAGTYTLVAYAHSTVSGAFAQVDAVTVTVAAQPFMNLEGPSDGATVGPSFTVGGWALDLSASSGTTGVDTVHVWAFPATDAAPIFVGADYGRARPDVGAVFGPAFTNSGFHLDVTNFPPGSYYLVAYAHDTVTGTFSIQRGATITIAATPPM